MSNAAAFAGFWVRNFPEQTCPSVPEQLSELGLTAQMAMQSDAPELYTAMSGGKSGYRLPADGRCVWSQGSWFQGMQRSYVLLVLRFKLSNVRGYAKRKQTKRWQITLRIVELFTNKRWSGLLLGKKREFLSGWVTNQCVLSKLLRINEMVRDKLAGATAKLVDATPRIADMLIAVALDPRSKPYK